MQTTNYPVICCGFTPCVQRVLEFTDLHKGRVNRAGAATVGIGGKGANTERMVRQLGGRSLLLGFSGGANGEMLKGLLDAEGVDYRFVETGSETRICQTLIEKGNPHATELVEEMPAVSADEWSRMIELVETVLLPGIWVSLSGRLPDGVPADGYGLIAAMVQQRNGRVILDAEGESLLSALEHQPFMVKINDEELRRTTDLGDVFDGCRELLAHGARSVLVTRGDARAIYMDAGQSLELAPPSIRAVNPVGSGDAVTAGLLFELNRGAELSDALVSGMACGAANALSAFSGSLSPDDVYRLKQQVQIIPVA